MRSWDIRSGAELWSSDPRDGLVTALAYSPAGDRLVSGWGGLRITAGETIIDDKSLRLWDPSDGRLILMLEGHENQVTAATFTRGGSRIASGSADETIRVWDAATGDVVGVLDAAANGSAPSVMVAGSELLAIGFESGDVQIRDTESYDTIRVLRGHDGNVASLAFSPDERRLASASPDDGSVLVWDVATGQTVAQLSSVDPELVTFSGDGTRLLAGERGGTLRIWETGSFGFVIALPTPAATTSAWGAATSRADPPETRIAFVSLDGLIRLLRLESR